MICSISRALASELMYSSNSIRPTLKAGTETLFRYICRDHGLNMAAADFFVRVKYTVPEAPVARKPEEVKSILYPEDAWDPILLDASSLATDRNMDELSVVSVSAGTGSSVAEVEIVDSMLKITPRAPGRTNITVLVSDGTHNVPVEIPVKVYDESEELKAPYLIYDQPVKIKAGETIQLPIEDLVADENDEYLYFHDEDPCFTWSPDLLEPSIHGRNLVIKALNPGKGNVYFKVKDGRLDAVFHIRVTVNSLPEMVPEIEKVSPQLTKIADMELDAEIATGSELRIKVADIFRDVDMDDVLSFRNPASSASGIAAVSLDGNDLVIEGVQEGVANITVEVYDGMESIDLTIHASVSSLKPIRISVETMPEKYPYVNDDVNGLDLTGMSIKALYNDGSSRMVTYPDENEWIITGFNDNNIAGDQNVTLTWEGVSVDFTVTVYSNLFKAISIYEVNSPWVVGDTKEKLLEKPGLRAW